MGPEPIWIGPGGLLGGGVVPATSGAAAGVGTIKVVKLTCRLF